MYLALVVSETCLLSFNIIVCTIPLIFMFVIDYRAPVKANLRTGYLFFRLRIMISPVGSAFFNVDEFLVKSFVA